MDCKLRADSSHCHRLTKTYKNLQSCRTKTDFRATKKPLENEVDLQKGKRIRQRGKHQFCVLALPKPLTDPELHTHAW